MGKKALSRRAKEIAEPCPLCEGTGDLHFITQRVAEDCMEVSVGCAKCLVATEEGVEDVWGLNDGSARAALGIWNDGDGLRDVHGLLVRRPESIKKNLYG
jgi:hypothetical protein